METIGTRVRRIREEQGIERKDLARDVGLSYSGLSDLESGKAKNTTKLHRLAARLSVDVIYLETGKESSKASMSGQETHSQTLRLNPDMIAETHRALRELYKENGRVFSIEEEPERFVQVYEIRAGMSEKPSQDEWITFGRKLIVLPRQGATNDGRGDGVPTQGAATRKQSGRVRRKA
jgi:transcriptional regulator with XRE-family HTH domain